MRRCQFVLLAAIAAFGFASVASAADLPVKASPAPMVASAPSWAGWYLGLNAGGNWGTSDGSTSYFCSNAGGSCYIASFNAAINALGASQNFDTDGFTGGIQGGYNWQTGSWVVGIETDFQYFRSAGSNTISSAAPSGGTLNISTSVSTDWLWTVRPRLGFAFNNWLVYATGGLAVTELKANWSFLNAPFSEGASASQVKAGWTAGGGLETMLPGRWSLGVEYLYVKFDNISATGVIGAPASAPFSNVFNHSTDLSSNIVRLRVSKFF